LADVLEGDPVDRRAIEAARRRCEEPEIRDETLLEVRRDDAVDQARGASGSAKDLSRLGADRVIPVPAVAREHRESPALRLEEVEDPTPRVVIQAWEAFGPEVGGGPGADHHVDIGVSGVRRIDVTTD